MNRSRKVVIVVEHAKYGFFVGVADFIIIVLHREVVWQGHHQKAGCTRALGPPRWLSSVASSGLMRRRLVCYLCSGAAAPWGEGDSVLEKGGRNRARRYQCFREADCLAIHRERRAANGEWDCKFFFWGCWNSSLDMFLYFVKVENHLKELLELLCHIYNLSLSSFSVWCLIFFCDFQNAALPISSLCVVTILILILSFDNSKSEEYYLYNPVCQCCCQLFSRAKREGRAALHFRVIKFLLILHEDFLLTENRTENECVWI